MLRNYLGNLRIATNLPDSLIENSDKEERRKLHVSLLVLNVFIQQR